MNEHTSTGMSGLTFSHFTAHTYDDDLNCMDWRMANLPMLKGFSPQRWQKGINVMLEKKKGNFNIDKLRTILLYEADFNHNNKWIGRIAMQFAEQDDTLA